MEILQGQNFSDRDPHFLLRGTLSERRSRESQEESDTDTAAGDCGAHHACENKRQGSSNPQKGECLLLNARINTARPASNFAYFFLV